MRVAFAASLSVLTFAPAALGQLTLTDGGASVSINTDGGLENFVVGGVDHLGDLSFALSPNGAAVETLSAANLLAIAPGLSTSQAFAVHTVGNYMITSEYTLTGSADSAALGVNVTITNLTPLSSASDFEIDLYQLVDWDLNGSTTDGEILSLNSQTLRQREGVGSDLIIADNAVNPLNVIDAIEVGETGSVLSSVVAGSLDGSSEIVGPDNLAFALGFLDQNGFGDSSTRTYILSTVFTVQIPTPGSMGLLALAGVGLLGRHRG
ncbi:MAG: hypothetical protein AAGI30_01575 [Planctomycetota bacterium]